MEPFEEDAPAIEESNRASSIGLCEFWEVTMPDIPSRSRLVPIEPIGIGTGFVESLTSYVTRLAEAHAVSVGDLVGRELSRVTPSESPIVSEAAERQPRLPHAFRSRSYAINGMGQAARKWVRALEAGTSRSDLAHLTLLPFEQLLSSRDLYRRVRAWCAQCNDDAKASGAIVYEPLLWTIRIVIVCPRHERPLDERCPHCHRNLTPLSTVSRPGYCSRCGQWLGLPVASDGSKANSDVTHADSQLCLAKAVGELLAAGLQSQAESLQLRVRRNLCVYAEELADGDLAALARFADCDKDGFNNWLNGRSLLHIDNLLRVCLGLNIPVSSLVSPIRPDAHLLSECAKGILCQPGRSLMRRRHPEQIRRAMQEALNERPAPSVNEIARRLGYKTTGQLYRADRALIKQIARNHRGSGGSSWSARTGGVPICDTQKLTQILKESLALNGSASPYQIAVSLGYVNAGGIRKRFPELCRDIRDKIARQRRARVEGIKRTLERALQENPPPTLATMSQRLGYSYRGSLRGLAPELCDKLLARRKAHEQGLLQGIRIELEAVLTEDPPPSMTTVWKRLGVSLPFLKSHFPDHCKAIVDNYEQHRQETTRRLRESLLMEVREIVAMLYRAGVVPSTPRVTALLREDSLREWKLVHWAVMEARRELWIGKSSYHVGNHPEPA